MTVNQYRTGFVATREDGVFLNFSQLNSKKWVVTYTPAPEALKIAASIDKNFSIPSSPLVLVEGNIESDTLVTHPLNTTATSPNFLRPKYDKINTITLDGFWLSDCDSIESVEDTLNGGLPSGFVKGLIFGLGIRYDLRFLIYTIEKIPEVTDVYLRKMNATGLPAQNGSSYIFSAKAFDDTRKAINRAHQNALAVVSEEKLAFVHNSLLTTLDPVKFPTKHRSYKKDAILNAIGEAIYNAKIISERDKDTVLETAKTTLKSVSNKNYETLLELGCEIELVTVKMLKEKMQNMLSNNLNEEKWQTFFYDNPFIIRLAFGTPIIVIGDKVSVGGKRLSGTGEKITDFMAKSALSGNLSIVEIKTANTPLLEKTAYRENIYAPSKELSGAVNQALDQRYQLQSQLDNIKNNSRIYDIEGYAIRCLIIIGKFPDDPDKQKSFEIFRNSLNSILIVTFDELFMRLDDIIEIVSPHDSGDDHFDGLDDDLEADDGDCPIIDHF